MSRAELKQFHSSSPKKREKKKPESEGEIVHTEKQIVDTKRKGRGPQKAPKKIPISLRLDKEVYEFFKASGRGWQTQINALLTEHISLSKSKTKVAAKAAAKPRKAKVTANSKPVADKVSKAAKTKATQTKTTKTKAPKSKAKKEAAKAPVVKVQKSNKPRKKREPFVEQQGSLF